MIALANLWLQAQAGIECSYNHIVADGQALGNVAVLAVNNIVAFVQAIAK